METIDPGTPPSIGGIESLPVNVSIDPPPLPAVQKRLPTPIRRIASEVSFSFNTKSAVISVQRGEVNSRGYVTTFNFTPAIATREEGRITVYPIELLPERDRKRYDDYEKVVSRRRVLTEFAYQPNPLALKQLRRDVL